VSRTWKAGDVVRATVPFRLRVEKALDDRTLQTLFHGPVKLVARNSATSYLPFGLYANAALSGDLLPPLTPVSGKPLLAPFHEGTEDPTHACFRRSEPKVIFGGLDSGVANPVRSDGTSLLDEIWRGRPSPRRACSSPGCGRRWTPGGAAGSLTPADGRTPGRS